MTRAKGIEGLIKYFIKIEYIFPYKTSTCIDLILPLATNYAVKSTTIIELTLSRFFKRQYSSLFRAIGGHFTSRKNKKASTEERIKARDMKKAFYLNWTFDKIPPLVESGIS